MTISIYKTRSGARRSFTDLQMVVLHRAGEWTQHDYVYLHADTGKPTQTNAEIADMIRKYPKLTHVGILHPSYCHPAQPFFIRNPKRYAHDATAPSFAVALQCASLEFGCDIVTINERDYKEEFKEVAAHWSVHVLII